MLSLHFHYTAAFPSHIGDRHISKCRKDNRPDYFDNQNHS